MSNIRVSYAGLINFTVILISFVTGLIFTIIVTRKLSPDEFGLWSLMGSLVLYVMIFKPINEYWTTRHIARNEEAGITAIASSGLFSAGSIGIFLVVIFIISSNSNADYDILLFSSILIPLTYISTIMLAITAGYKPQGSGYGMLIFEITKIPIGFVLVYLADWGIVGAITTTSIATCIQIIFYVYYLKDKLKGRFDVKLLKNWFKLSWLSMFGATYSWIQNLDRTIFILFSGSVAGLAYVGVATAISQLISSSRAMSSALYPKLIASQKEQYIELMLQRVLLIAIPLLGFTLVFAKSGLWVLNPLYVDGVSIVIIWSFSHFVQVFHTPLSGALLGLERVDIGFKSKFKDYIKSKLFFTPLVYLISYSSYIIVLIVIMHVSTQFNLQELEIIFWWGVGGTISNIGILIAFWIKLNKQIELKFPLIHGIKYVIVTIIAFTITLWSTKQFLVYEESIFIFLPSLIPHMLLFFGIYLPIIVLWDKATRQFLHLIINEFKSK